MNHKTLASIVYLKMTVASASEGIVLSNTMKAPSPYIPQRAYHARDALIPRHRARIKYPFHGHDRKDRLFNPHSFLRIAAPRLRLRNSLRNAGKVAFE